MERATAAPLLAALTVVVRGVRRQDVELTEHVTGESSAAGSAATGAMLVRRTDGPDPMEEPLNREIRPVATSPLGVRAGAPEQSE